MIFGRKNCNHDTNWAVDINLISGAKLTVGEQLPKKEAIEMYEKLVNELKNKSEFLVVNTDLGSKIGQEGEETFAKKHILSVEYYIK